jgi:hypothetical protein
MVKKIDNPRKSPRKPQKGKGTSDLVDLPRKKVGDAVKEILEKPDFDEFIKELYTDGVTIDREKIISERYVGLRVNHRNNSFAKLLNDPRSLDPFSFRSYLQGISVPEHFEFVVYRERYLLWSDDDPPIFIPALPIKASHLVQKMVYGEKYEHEKNRDPGTHDFSSYYKSLALKDKTRMYAAMKRVAASLFLEYKAEDVQPIVEGMFQPQAYEELLKYLTRVLPSDTPWQEKVEVLKILRNFYLKMAEEVKYKDIYEFVAMKLQELMEEICLGAGTILGQYERQSEATVNQITLSGNNLVRNFCEKLGIPGLSFVSIYSTKLYVELGGETYVEEKETGKIKVYFPLGIDAEGQFELVGAIVPHEIGHLLIDDEGYKESYNNRDMKRAVQHDLEQIPPLDVPEDPDFGEYISTIFHESIIDGIGLGLVLKYGYHQKQDQVNLQKRLSEFIRNQCMQLQIAVSVKKRSTYRDLKDLNENCVFLGLQRLIAFLEFLRNLSKEMGIADHTDSLIQYSIKDAKEFIQNNPALNKASQDLEEKVNLERFLEQLAVRFAIGSKSVNAIT